MAEDLLHEANGLEQNKQLQASIKTIVRKHVVSQIASSTP